MGGFSAVLGNPPFLGGQKLTGTYGNQFRDFIVQTIANDTKGSADLCSYFFLVCFESIRNDGRAGLVATNTIAQGATREIGLAQIISKGGVISAALVDVPWSGDAAVMVNLVTIKNGMHKNNAILNGINVEAINEYLRLPGDVIGDPYRLQNNSQLAFQGSTVVGDGFVLENNLAADFIQSDFKNGDVVFRYITGKDVNSHPQSLASRHIINFFDWPKDKAKEYTDPWDLIENKVKPFRQRKPPKNSTAKGRFEKYWIYGSTAKRLYELIKNVDYVLLMARVSKTVKPVRVDANQVFSDACVVFRKSDDFFLGTLTSDLHYVWVAKYASSMKGDTRYTPKDVFETFPMPDHSQSVEQACLELNDFRTNFMNKNNEGLTKTYNRVHNPEDIDPGIEQLRRLHTVLDLTVRDAYGWQEIELGHGFHDTKQGTRWTISPEAQRQVLDRLLALNHERYRLENGG